MNKKQHDGDFLKNLRKTLRIMRLSLFLIVISTAMAFSANTYSQNAKLTMDLNNVTVKEVIKAIENQSEFLFFYQEKHVDLNRQVTLHSTEQDVETILNQLFAGTDNIYVINDRQIVIGVAPRKELEKQMLNLKGNVKPVIEQPQQKEITGKVTDTDDLPLPGVSVIVKGTTIGTVTNADGEFSLNIPLNAETLQFSFVGMKTQDIPVTGITTIDVVMAEDAFGIEEVVAIGYGTVKKKDLTGAVASVKGESLAAYPVSDVTQALQGKIPGVTITSVDGRPGADVSIRIRGGGSITQSNDPLFIVDEFPVNNISDIPASQIETITILKDASSTAIYGARGANGVVIITTKSPKEGKLSISYDANYRVNTPSKYLGALDPYDFVKLNWDFTKLFGLNDAFERAYGLGTEYRDLNPGGINAYQNIPGTDIEKQIIGTTYSQNHTVAVSGGSSKTKYSVSLDYLDDDGLKIQSWEKRTNILAKIQSEIAKGLVLNVDAFVTDKELFGSESQSEEIGSKLTNSMRFTPVSPLGDISGENTQLGLYETYIRDEFNPIGAINDIYSKSDNQTYRGSASLAWTIIDGLTLKTVYDHSKGFGSGYYFIGAFAKKTVGVEGGNASVDKSYSTSYRWANTLNYDFKLPGVNHKLNMLLGQEMRGSDWESTSLSGTRYPISFDYKRAFAMMNQYGDQNEVSISNSYGVPGRSASFFGRINYIFKDRFYLTTTLRADGSSNFAPAHRWGYFPAAAVAWRISEEPFIKGISAIDNLKLRLSYGEAGNDRISSGLWKSDWTGRSDGYANNNVGSAYYAPASSIMTNPDLKWETTITRNMGLDYSFFNNRLSGTIDAYWNTTKDLLMLATLPSFTGYTNQMDNLGQTRNIGTEFSITGDIVRSRDLRVSANFNIATNKNKIEALSEEFEYQYYSSNWTSTDLRPISGDYVFRVGDPVGLIRGYVYDGFYTTDDFNYDEVSQTYLLKDGVANSFGVIGVFPGFSTLYPGMIKLKKLGTETSETDINESDDATVIGNTNPKFTGGFNLNATYKSFDLLVGFNWSYGNDVYNVNKLANSIGRKLPFRNFSKTVDGWYSTFKIDNSGNLERVYAPAELDALNANATGPMPFHEFSIVTSDAVEDGSFLRLNNVTVGYTLPGSLTRRILVQRLRFFATATNVWLLTNYSGYDPEVDAGNHRNSNYPTPSMDFGAYPRARTFTFGVNVNF